MDYSYKCTNCNTELVISHSMKEDFKTYCPECKTESLKRHITTVPCVTFKGEGWASKEIRANSLAKV